MVRRSRPTEPPVDFLEPSGNSWSGAMMPGFRALSTSNFLISLSKIAASVNVTSFVATKTYSDPSASAYLMPSLYPAIPLFCDRRPTLVDLMEKAHVPSSMAKGMLDLALRLDLFREIFSFNECGGFYTGNAFWPGFETSCKPRDLILTLPGPSLPPRQGQTFPWSPPT